MANRGFEETKSAYAPEDPRQLVGQIRRLGEYGPAYEIMSVDDAGTVVIEVIESGEQVKFPIAGVLEDPMAGTIP